MIFIVRNVDIVVFNKLSGIYVRFMKVVCDKLICIIKVCIGILSR